MILSRDGRAYATPRTLQDLATSRSCSTSRPRPTWIERRRHALWTLLTTLFDRDAFDAMLEEYDVSPTSSTRHGRSSTARRPRLLRTGNA
jgi:hypothetical protein